MILNDPCHKCRRLRQKRAISSLSAFEEAWLQEHWLACPECAADEAADLQVRAVLRASASNIDASHDFDEKLLRRVRLDRGARTLAYWSPAFVGAALAGIAALALIQVLAFRPDPKPAVLEGREARRVELPVIPDSGFTIHR
ncbi:MAG: hypothetical protein IT207_06950 [Fimbriimonadaceae bacterium]|nr:hypothetical protein [Fimbriimonadaceae bacterium]